MKILTVLGARPQFVKAATTSRALREIGGVHEVIVHTGQHHDHNMSDIFFQQMEIPKPDHFLGISGLSHGAMTGQMLEKVEAVCLEEKPDLLLVYGDTNSTLAGALAASKLHIPLAHVEAGLRSFNVKMPEEINRILTDRVSSLLFCPTQTAVNNLEREGYRHLPCEILQVGDVMYDSVVYYKPKSRAPEGLSLPAHFALATVHRAENTSDPETLKRLWKGLEDIAANTPVILPLHPRTQKLLKNWSLESKNIRLLEPVGYFEMLYLLEACDFVLTDSGGLQKEAYFFHKPCITLREQTEWTELVEVGHNQLVGTSPELLFAAAEKIRTKPAKWPQSLYGEGNAAVKIAEKLKQFRR